MHYSFANDLLVLIGANGVGTVNRTAGTMQGWTLLTTGGNALGPPDGEGNILLASGTNLSTSSIGAVGGIISTDYVFTNWLAVVTPGGLYCWDPLSDSVWVWLSGGQIYRLFLNRLTGKGVDVADVIQWLCAQTDLQDYQCDVSEIVGRYGVQGIQLGQQSVRESILQLLQIFQIDAVETDGCIRFLPRDRMPLMTVLEEDIGANENLTKSEPRVQEVLQNETDTPERISLIYNDLARDFQPALQYDKRISQPFASNLAAFRNVTNSRLQQTITTPLSSDANTMKQQAQKMVYDAWAGRFSYTFKTAIKLLFLDPCDVVSLNYKGNMIELRLAEVDRGAGLAMQFKGQSHDYQVYASIATSTPGGMLPSQ